MAACVFSGFECRPLRQDPGRELVNAAGLSKTQVLAILSKGNDVNTRSTSTFGWSPLISAIYHHKEDVIDLLLARGADVNEGDDRNQTPLVWAIEVWGTNTDLIRKLIDHGADASIRNRFGINAFDAARVQSNPSELLGILGSAQEHRGR